MRIEPFDPLTTTVSYFLGNDSAQWHPAVPVYGGVRYVDLYPGVDLVLDGQDASGVWRPNQALKPRRSGCRSRAPRSCHRGRDLRLAAEGESL